MYFTPPRAAPVRVPACASWACRRWRAGNIRHLAFCRCCGSRLGGQHGGTLASRPGLQAVRASARSLAGTGASGAEAPPLGAPRTQLHRLATEEAARRAGGGASSGGSGTGRCTVGAAARPGGRAMLPSGRRCPLAGIADLRWSRATHKAAPANASASPPTAMATHALARICKKVLRPGRGSCTGSRCEAPPGVPLFKPPGSVGLARARRTTGTGTPHHCGTCMLRALPPRPGRWRGA